MDVTGAFSVENGHYDGVTNTLYVSVNAGMQSITDITGSAILKTASHEITHYIAASGTQTYSLLEDYVLSRFTEQYGEKSVDNRIEDIQEQYKDQVGKELTREQAKEEMVAAACEMMLKNSEVFEKLARQNLTLAQRIKAGLDGFIKKLSANRKAAFENLDATSPEARAIAASEVSLKETQKLWDNALKGAIKENQSVADGSRGDVKMSELRDEGRYNAEHEKPITSEDIEPLRSIGRKNINNFTSEDIAKTQKWAYKFYRELGTKSPFFRASFGEWRAYDTSPVNISKMERREGKNPRGQFRNNDTGWVINSSSVGYDETISHSGADKKSVRAMQNIDKIIENSILLNTETSEHGRGKKSIYTAFMHKFYALVDIDGKPYLAKMSVDESYSPGQNETNKKFYHVRSIEIETAPSVGIGNSHTPIMESTVSNYTVSDLYTFVKQFDKDFSAGAAVNPKLLNRNGTPRVMYHYTDSTFTVFDPARSGSNQGMRLGDGIYISSSKTAFMDYGKNRMDVYADIKHPFEMKLTKAQADEVLNTYAATKHNLDAYGGVYRKHAQQKLMTPTRVMDYLSEYAADNGIKTSDILKHLGYDGIHDGIEWVAFDPTQIKSATDNIGTFDRNNPDIRYELRDNQGRELTKAQAEKFKDSQVRDKDGRLKTVYHGSSAVFNVFSADFMSQHGSSEGQGFYFTDYKDMAEGYQKKGGQLLEGYLNITNPLSDSEVTLSAPEVKRLLKALDPTGDDVILNYDSQGGMGYPSKAWYNRALADTVNMIMSTSESDSEILAEIANAGAGSGNVMDAVRKVLGYDGYIVEGKYDNANVYVAFGSDQFKSFDNKTPTSSPDIHLELRSDENQFNPRKELSNLFMQIAQNEQETKSLRSYQAAIHELNNTEIEISKLQQEMQGTDKLKSPQKYYELQNKLRQAEAKLNRYDGRLVQLEATKPMKDLIARREQRLKEQFARSSTTRAKYRNNIKKNIRSLDKKLRTNSGQKHVLLELQPVVAQLLNVFTENTSVFKKEQLAKLREIYAKFNPEADSKISSDEKEVTRWKSTAEYSSAYSEMIYDLIEEVRPLVQGKRLIDLDTELLAAVNDIVSNIKQKNTVPESLPRRRFSAADQSEHFTAKPPLKK